MTQPALQSPTISARPFKIACEPAGPARFALTPRPRLPTSRSKLWVVIGSLVVVTLVRFAAKYYQSPLRTLPVEEAIRRATTDVRVQTALGGPIRQGNVTRDKMYYDETGWSEAKLTVPLRGSRRAGTLKVVAGKGTGAWIFSTLSVYPVGEAQPIDLLNGKLELAADPDYQSVHTEKPVTPELLDPKSDATPAWDGTYPVLAIHPQPPEARPYTVEFASEKLGLHLQPMNVFEVDLTSGLFILRQTDLLVDDVMPLALTRTYRPWDRTSRAFGLGTNHSYDIAPEGTRNPYTFMEIHLEDDSRAHFDRISRGTGYADAVYEQHAAASEFYKARIWWNGNGWTLKFADGRLVLFPESYNAKTMSQGAPVEIRDSAGHRIRLERDPDRNLRLLVSPNGHFIRFEYDIFRRITEATDDLGSTVRYEYDSPGRLIAVHGADGRVTRFTYNEERMLMVQDGSGHTLLRNRYEYGRVAEQDLSDGSVYRFEYQFSNNEVVKTLVIGPDGARTLVAFTNGVWKQQVLSAGLLQTPNVSIPRLQSRAAQEQQSFTH